VKIEYLDKERGLLKPEGRNDLRDKILSSLKDRRWRPDIKAIEFSLMDIPILKGALNGEVVEVCQKVGARYKDIKERETHRVILHFSTSFYRRIEIRYNKRYIDERIVDVVDQYCDNGSTMLGRSIEVEDFAAEARLVGAKIEYDTKVDEYIKRLRDLQESDMDNLNLPLRSYQQEGAIFLALTQRAICADEMGTGKTASFICTCTWLKEKGLARRVLVIAPASLLYNWENEVEKFSDEKPLIIEGTPKKRMPLYQALQNGTETAFFVLINYEKVVRDQKHLMSLEWDVIGLDEGQRIKNPETRQAKAVKDLGVGIPNKYVLTGTPLENKLEELFSIMQFVDPTIFGSYRTFMNQHFVYGGFNQLERIGYKDLELCNRRVYGAMIRRTKDQVAKEMPEKIIKTIKVPLSDHQKKLYIKLKKKATKDVKNNYWYGIAADFSLLRMLADDSMLLHLSNSELIDNLFEREKIKQSSSKLDVLVEVSTEAMESEKKIVIFTQWVRMAHIIKDKMVELFGDVVLYVDGSLDNHEKQRRVWQFWGSENEENEYFRSGPDDIDQYEILVTTDALNYGQNLHCADILVNFDPLYNPKKQEQRDARIHRLGITDTKYIINIIAKNTVEESILRMQKRKRDLFDDVVGDMVSDSRDHQELVKEILEGVE